MHADRAALGLTLTLALATALTLTTALTLSTTGCPGVGAARPAPPLPPLPEGGTIVLLGDSTTWHDVYPKMLARELRRRYPERRLRVVNRGARADTVPRALARLERDVIAERPVMVVVLLGINDGGYGRPNRHLLSRYRANMATLVRRLRAARIRKVVLVTTTCVRPDSWENRAYNRMLALMAAELRDLGGQLRVPVIDLFTHFHRRVLVARDSKPPVVLMADDNHPNAAGYKVVGDFVLRHLLRR